ncbi:MAG TPA: tetratricopeptide repeat protein [Thermoanaerobaculia bacterium]|jgi:tetratricopeptide (TPR) repeat protein|nr:tetratricopeptide repeat protein [Thermoanaerobaculia bacterium]
MSEHPSAAELEGLVRGDLTREQAKLVVRHLLRGCESCLAFVAPYASGLLDRFGRHGHPGTAGPGAAALGQTVVASLAGRPGRAGGTATPLPAAPAPTPLPAAAERGGRNRAALESAYERAIDRAFAAVLRHGEQAARTGAKVREMLAQLAAGGLDGMCELPAELRGFAGFEALLERSWAMRREDPRQMVKLAELAATVAAGLGDEGFSSGQVDEFQARAEIELANAYRVMDRLDEARSGIEVARRHFLAGSQDRLLGARLLEVEANIHGDRGELDEALAALEVVLRTYRRYGDPHLAGRSLIKKGIYTARAGRRQEAIELFTEGIEMIDPRQDGPLVLAAVHNTACCLLDDGRCREARSLLWRHLAFYEQHAGRQDRLKLRWLQAQIHAGLGQVARAERAFEEVRLGLREAGKTHCEAMATVDLAGLHQRQGRDEEARSLAIAAAELLLGLALSSETSAALELLKSRLEQAAVLTPELAAQAMHQIVQILRETAPDDQPILLVRSA